MASHDHDHGRDHDHGHDRRGGRDQHDPVRLGGLAAGLREFYYGPYRRTMARAARDQDDLFMLYVCGEALGVPNPASWYTMELLPIVLEEFHDWHTRMGMEKWPGDIGLSCC